MKDDTRLLSVAISLCMDSMWGHNHKILELGETSMIMAVTTNDPPKSHSPSLPS